MWLGIVIQQLVPHTGNEVEEVRVGGGFTGVIQHYVIRTLQEGGREGGRVGKEGGGRREGEGGMSALLITNVPSTLFLRQSITHNLAWFPGTSSKPHSQVLEIDPVQLETQSEASENTCLFPYSIHSHHRPKPLCSAKLSCFFQLKTKFQKMILA